MFTSESAGTPKAWSYDKSMTPRDKSVCDSPFTSTTPRYTVLLPGHTHTVTGMTKFVALDKDNEQTTLVFLPETTVRSASRDVLCQPKEGWFEVKGRMVANPAAPPGHTMRLIEEEGVHEEAALVNSSPKVEDVALFVKWVNILL